MTVKLGLDCKLYRNTGTYGSPTWVEMQDVRNVTLPLEKAEADVTTRANGGWRAVVGTLKEAPIEFEILNNLSRTASGQDIAALRDSWLENTSIEFAVLDGDIETEGTEGLRATMEVMQFQRAEELENAVTYTVTIKPTLGAQAPEWMEIAGS